MLMGKHYITCLNYPLKVEIALSQLQQIFKRFSGVKYLLIDEYSVISQRELSWINRRCKQAAGCSERLFCGINIILVGDLGQLPPVNDKVLCDCNHVTEHDSQDYFLYSQFETVDELVGNERVSGFDSSQEMFRNLLRKVKNGAIFTVEWKLLLTRSPSRCNNMSEFSDALRLSYGNKKVAEDNINSLKGLGNPIAKIKAIHNKQSAAKCTVDDMGGLQVFLYLSVGARVMLTRNLWTEVGLCNGALGTAHSIIFETESYCFPVAVVKFDTYSGPAFVESVTTCVPSPLCCSTSDSLGSNCERTQFPLKLAWAITIHKSQGLT